MWKIVCVRISFIIFTRQQAYYGVQHSLNAELSSHLNRCNSLCLYFFLKKKIIQKLLDGDLDTQTKKQKTVNKVVLIFVELQAQNIKNQCNWEI